MGPGRALGIRVTTVLRGCLRRVALSLALVAAAAAGFFGTSSASAAGTFTILDTLGAATPTTSFSVFGSGGTGISPSQNLGPQFTLGQDTLVTEIGAFINMHNDLALPPLIQIRPAVNGLPGASVVGTFVMSNDGDPFTVSYESATPNLMLEAGTYFALFAPQGTDEGTLLGSASVPFNYLAGLTDLGFLDPTSGSSGVFGGFGAVRIAGKTATAHDQLTDLLAVVDGELLGPGTSFHDKLVDALAYADADMTTAACDTLRAFIAQVKAQTGKSLTSERANALIADALSIKDLLGC